jgi:hypothetical protein
MIGQSISHYKILEKPRHKDGGQVSEGGMRLMFNSHDTMFNGRVVPTFPATKWSLRERGMIY